MKKKSTVFCTATFLSALSMAADVKKPNVIVILTDDQGYADLSCMGIEPDLKTPNLDRLAAEGVRFTNGYVSAPQCGPSRAGLLTGRYQTRFGYDVIGHGPLPLSEKTLADRLDAAGYATGMVGKWHQEPSTQDRDFIDQYAPGPEPQKERFARIDPKILDRYHPHERGFQETFFGYFQSYSATYDLNGKRFDTPRKIPIEHKDRLDNQSEGALKFIDLHHDDPFFLYLAYYGPHVPLASSEKYLDRFPGKMPERRRYALAMISSIDDGVGRIMDRLDQYGIDENTLIFFVSDNGAPLQLYMTDQPISFQGGAWDGSKNTPLNGEKGMLAEGGIRVPFLARWKGTIPGGQICDTPVISLDIAATACELAGIGHPEELDGVNLMPLLTEGRPLPERPLFWRFWNQTAVRRGDWKFLKMGNQQSFLFNLANDREEKKNLLSSNPEIAAELERLADKWAADLKPAGVPNVVGNIQEVFFYQHWFEVPLPPKYKPAQNPFK
ncbi:MAG: sulfatase-like hydrolase/transferase [Kiritimatiellales bacterium]